MDPTTTTTQTVRKSTKRASEASGQPGQAKRVRKEKKKKKKGGLLRMFKINAELFEALATKQRDLGTDGPDTPVGYIAAKGDCITLDDIFFAVSGGKDKGLSKTYLLDEIKRPVIKSQAQRAAATAEGSKKKKKKTSNEIPVKVFTKDINDKRFLAADIGTEYQLKLPRGARRFVKQAVVQKMTIVDTVMRDSNNSKKDTKITTAQPNTTTTTEPPGPGPRLNEAQVQGAIFQAFRRQFAWTAKELAISLNLNVAHIKKHLKAVGAFYHQAGLHVCCRCYDDHEFRTKLVLRLTR